MYYFQPFFLALELFPREVVVKNTLLALVLVCFGFVGLSRLSCPNLFSIVYRNYFSNKVYDSTLNDSEKIAPFANALLAMNLIITLNVCIVSLVHSTLEAEMLMRITFGISVMYLLFSFVSPKLVAVLFGDKLFGKTLGMHTQQVINLSGLLLLILALLALLNDAYKVLIQFFVYFVIFSLPFVKSIKGIRYAKVNNYRWLYIILYLCTLEIIPVLMLGHYFVGKI